MNGYANERQARMRELALQRRKAMGIIEASHCQACGSTSREDLDGEDGYSACCNEIVVWPGACTDGHCYHKGVQA